MIVDSDILPTSVLEQARNKVENIIGLEHEIKKLDDERKLRKNSYCSTVITN